MTTLSLRLDAPRGPERLAARTLRLAAALRAGAARRATLAELSRLDARTLRDIGLSRDDLPGTAAALAPDLALRLSLR